MSDYTPRVGHRVRVVAEGVVCQVDGLGWFRMHHGGDQIIRVNSHAPVVVSIERLPDPEPDWQLGDVVLDAEGVIHERSAGYSWWQPGIAQPRPHDYPARPLVLVVRDGKPWTEATDGAA